MRRAWIVVAMVVLVGCDEGKGKDYSDQLRRNFLAACDQSSEGEESGCECLLDELESRMTEAEYLALEEKGEEAFLADERVQEALSICR